MSEAGAPPPACGSSSSVNTPYPPQQHQPPPYYGQAPSPAYGQPAYGYGPQQPGYPPAPGYGYPPQQPQPAPYPGAVDPYPPQQQPPPQYPPQYPYPTAYPAAYPATGAIPMATVSPMVAAMPLAVPVASVGPALPLDHIIELDLGVIRALPPHTDIATVEEVPGAHKEWVPRPLVWVETDWAKKPFVYVSSRVLQNTSGSAINTHAYRCVLHRLDGAPCGAIVETTTETALADHLRAFHSIVEPARPQRRWKHSLLSGLCSLTCIDFMLMPCCFVGRLSSMNMDPQGAVVASYVRSALGCGDESDWCGVCMIWTFATPIMLIFYVPFPCLLCLGIAACLPDLELRQRIARKHNIVETECESGMAVCFCCPCSDIQVHREIESAGVWPGYCCCSRNAPLRSPEEVQQDFNAITREGVVRSRQGYNALSAVALQAMQ